MIRRLTFAAWFETKIDVLQANETRKTATAMSCHYICLPVCLTSNARGPVPVQDGGAEIPRVPNECTPSLICG